MVPFFQIFVNLAILVSIMGWAPAFAGLLVTIALIPVTGIFTRQMTRIRKRILSRTDARMELLSEVRMGLGLRV